MGRRVSTETNDERAQREQWEAFVAESEARGVCPFSGYTFKRCAASICDCFREQFPDDPYGLHPEAFIVNPPTEQAAE